MTIQRPDTSGRNLLSVRRHLLHILASEKSISLLSSKLNSRRAPPGWEQRLVRVGGTIYDGLIAACAKKARAERLYTWNARHFDLLGAEVQKLIAKPPVI